MIKIVKSFNQAIKPSAHPSLQRLMAKVNDALRNSETRKSVIDEADESIHLYKRDGSGA